MAETGFSVTEQCIGCGRCVKVCPGGVLSLGMDGRPEMAAFEDFGWNGCWRCEHCMAVCPVGAIRIFGRDPAESLAPIQPNVATAVLDALIAGRHSCRRYQRRDVPTEVIGDMLSRLGNAPNGGNKQLVEFTLIDDMAEMDHLRKIVSDEMWRLAAQGIYAEGFDQASYDDMKRWEATVRPDMLFCGAPHLLIPHAPLGQGEPRQDVLIVGTYFELLCASRGLGAVMMTFPLDVLNKMPEVKALLEIPEDHFVGMMIGFGYAEIPYARGSQRQVEDARIHRLHFRR